MFLESLMGHEVAWEYFESDDYVLSSAVGHLLELVVPEDFEDEGRPGGRQSPEPIRAGRGRDDHAELLDASR